MMISLHYMNYCPQDIKPLVFLLCIMRNIRLLVLELEILGWSLPGVRMVPDNFGQPNALP